MSFSKAPVHRFNETISISPPPSRYNPNMNSKIKGLVPYNNQKGPRFQSSGPHFTRSAERCCSQNSVKHTTNLCHGILLRDTDCNVSQTGDEKIRAKPTGSRASISYVPRHPPLSKKLTGSFNDMATANAMLSKRNILKGSPFSDKQNKRGFETQFLSKKKKLNTMKKELFEKQKEILQVHSSMTNLRDRVLDSTGKDLGPVEEIKIIDLGNIKNMLSVNHSTSEDKPSNKKHQAEGAGEALNVNLFLDSCSNLLEKLEKRLQEIPTYYVELCNGALSKRTTLSDMLSNLKFDNKIESDEESRLHEQLEQYIHDGDDLCKQLEITKNDQYQKISEVLNDIRGMSIRKEASEDILCNKTESELKEKLELLAIENTNLVHKLKFCSEELDCEREKGSSLKDHKSSVDVQLKTARQKLRDMEQKLSSDEVKIAQLLSQMKILEGQIKIKESSFDHKVKELLKNNKSATEQITKLEKQRESLELRVLDLKRAMNTKEEEAVVVITELQNKLNEVIQNLEEERNSKLTVEAELSINKQRMLEVEEKGRQLAEMAEKTKSIVVTGEESKHSEREVELWTELQSTRVLLKSAEGQINILREEKSKFMETINKATNEDNGAINEICAKFGVEMVEKDDQIKHFQEQIKHFQAQIKELIDSVGNSQDQNILLEKQLKEYEEKFKLKTEITSAHLQMQNQVSELQQQMLDLQSTLSEVVHQNEQLQQALTQKQLEVEQRDRVMREQSKVLKVRDELIGLLKGKEERQDEQIITLQSTLDEREKNVNKVNKEIAVKAEEMQELYTTLEAKQIQVMRLEKLVKQMEDQQERGQAQRTRHEARIAQLEHVLQDKRNPRYFYIIPTHSSNSLHSQNSDNTENVWHGIQSCAKEDFGRANLNNTSGCIMSMSTPKILPGHGQFGNTNQIKIQIIPSSTLCDKINKSEIRIQKSYSKYHVPTQKQVCKHKSEYKIVNNQADHRKYHIPTLKYNYKDKLGYKTVKNQSSHNTCHCVPRQSECKVSYRKSFCNTCSGCNTNRCQNEYSANFSNQLVNSKCKNSIHSMKKTGENNSCCLQKCRLLGKASSLHQTDSCLSSCKRQIKHMTHACKEFCNLMKPQHYYSISNISNERQFQLPQKETDANYCCYLNQETMHPEYKSDHKSSVYNQEFSTKSSCNLVYSSSYISLYPINSSTDSNYNSYDSITKFDQTRSYSDLHQNSLQTEDQFLLEKASCFWYPNNNEYETSSSEQIYKLVKINKFSF